MTSTQTTTRSKWHPTTIATIETLARECAAQAIEQGATGPWTGDMQQADIEYVTAELGRRMTLEEGRAFDRAFRGAFAG